MERKTTSRKALTVKEKTEIFKFIDENKKMKQKDIAAKYKMSSSTLSDILRNRAHLEKVAREHSSVIKRLKTSKFERVDRMLIQWFYQALANNISVNGTIMRDKAKEIASQLGVPNFAASNGWFGRFKTRYDVLHKKTSGRNRPYPFLPLTVEGADCWKSDILPAIIAAYDPKDVYSADIFGLSSNMFSFRSIVHCSTATTTGVARHSKDIFSILLCSNFDGSDRLKPWIFGTSENLESECSSLYTYIVNTSAWMTGVEFKRWIAEIDAKMAATDRKILLFVDNAAAHSDIPDSTNVKIILSPPNTTSCLLPIHQDIIKTIRQQMQELAISYLKDLNTREIAITKELMRYHVLKAVCIFVESWQKEKNESFKNCFTKYGFFVGSNKSNNEGIVEIKRECPSPTEEDKHMECPILVKTEAILEEYNDERQVSIISEEQRTEKTMDTLEIINEFEEETPTVTAEQVLVSLDNIKNFMAQNDDFFGEAHWNNLAELENIIFVKNALDRRKQMTVLEK